MNAQPTDSTPIGATAAANTQVQTGGAYFVDGLN